MMMMMMGGWSQLSPSRTVVTSFTPRRCGGSNQQHGTTGYSSPVTAAGGVVGNYYNHLSNFHSNSMDAFEQGDWALCLAAPNNNSNVCGTSAARTVSCALSNGDIQVYDQERMHHVTTFSSHYPSSLSSSLITNLVYGPTNEHCLVSTSQDGGLTVYDLRAGAATATTATAPAGGAVLKTRIPAGQAALSVSLGYDGCIAAIGATKGRVHFIDLRAAGGSMLGSFVDAHSDNVTCVEFCNNNGNGSNGLLLSAAEDGLACLFDTTQPTEEAALKSIVNVGTPIRRAGFCSSPSSSTETTLIWCLTGSESASLWNADTTCCVQDFGVSLREKLSQTLTINNNMGTNNNNNNNQTKRRLDYLIDAYWMPDSQELMLSAGNVEGDVGIFRLASSSSVQHHNHHHHQQQQFQYNPLFHWQACHWMTGGHRGVVRAACHLSQSIVMTGGEDARICEWNRLGPQAQAAGGGERGRGRGGGGGGIGMGAMTTSCAGLGQTTTTLNNNNVVTPSVFSNGGGGVLATTPTLTSLMVRGSGFGGGPVRRQRNRPSNAPY